MSTRADASQPVGLLWLVTVRWASVVAAIGAIVAGRSMLGASVSIVLPAVVIGLVAATNFWLGWRASRAAAPPVHVAGLLVAFDVVLLSWLLLRYGGVLNPASIFFLVQIVLAALVLDRRWTITIAALAIAGYGAQLITPSEELVRAQQMHPKIGLHITGMWWAFAATALIVTLLVARLASAVERRDRALRVLQDEASRTTRLASLATLAAGAAHELGTPLATIAIAAAELERDWGHAGVPAGALEDLRLIRAETDRCRRVLQDLSGRLAAPHGEAPRATTVRAIVAAAIERLKMADRARIHLAPSTADVAVVWPVGLVALALGNVLDNAVQASPRDEPVDVQSAVTADGAIELRVIDRGPGLTPDDVRRIGEPFFTTKPQGTGLGLGVFIARSTMASLGGDLLMDSTPGSGTIVTLRLPPATTAHDVPGPAAIPSSTATTRA